MHLDSRHDWHAISARGYWIGYSGSSRQVLQNCAFILAEAFEENPHDLAIESKVLEILSETFARVEAGQAGTEEAKLSKRHQRMVTTARDLLLDELAHPWTISQLAQRTGLNEKSLKHSFRLLFGIPVYRFLQSERLNSARHCWQLVN